MPRLTKLIILSLTLAAWLPAGCQSSGQGMKFEIKPAWNHKVDGLTHYSLANGFNIWIQESPIVTGVDIKRAWYVTDDNGNPAVMIELDAAGTARLSRFTSGHLQQPLAVFLDHELVSAPNVLSTIGKQFMIMGIGSKSDAELFIQQYQAGQHPQE